MWWTLMWKEFRECALYAGVALLFQMHILGESIGLPLIPMLTQRFDSNGAGQIPFIGVRHSTFTAVASLLAIVLGFHQTAWESWRQTTLFLLHRPMPRLQIFAAKLSTGILLIIAAAVLPLLLFSFWASTPGTHASPFFWSFTEPYWRGTCAAVVCYLGAFLSGLRSARWIGSRTWPLIAAFILAQVLKEADLWFVLIYAGMLALVITLSASILETSRLREYP